MNTQINITQFDTFEMKVGRAVDAAPAPAAEPAEDPRTALGTEVVV